MVRLGRGCCLRLTFFCALDEDSFNVDVVADWHILVGHAGKQLLQSRRQHRIIRDREVDESICEQRQSLFAHPKTNDETNNFCSAQPSAPPDLPELSGSSPP